MLNARLCDLILEVWEWSNGVPLGLGLRFANEHIDLRMLARIDDFVCSTVYV